jgi:hypothetical protein
MTLRDGARELGSRAVEVSGSDCKKARETVVLIAVMLLDVPLTDEPTEPAPPKPSEPAAPAKPAPPRQPVDLPPAPRPKRSSLSLLFEVSLSAAATFAFLPRFGAGGRGQLAFGIKDVPLVFLSGGASGGATVEAPQGRVEFSGVELGAGVAPLSVRFSPRWVSSAFAGLALTAIRADATGFTLARSETVWVPSGTVGLALRFRPLGEHLVALLDTRLLVPFRRPSFAVQLPSGAAFEVHSVQDVGFDVGAGLGWEFR